MKTKITYYLLVINGLLFCAWENALAQSSYRCFYYARKFIDFHAASCFSKTFLGFSFENKQLSKELMNEYLYGNFVLEKNIIPLYIQHYGINSYGQLTLSSGYGRIFGNKFSMSSRFYYLLEHAKHYSSRHSLYVDFSFAYCISHKLNISASIVNPFNLRYGVFSSVPIPIIFNVLTTYELSDKITYSLQLKKVFQGGLFEVVGEIFSRPLSGFILDLSCSNHSINVGVNIHFKNFIITAKSSWHYRLNISPMIQFLYFNQNKMWKL